MRSCHGTLTVCWDPSAFRFQLLSMHRRRVDRLKVQRHDDNHQSVPFSWWMEACSMTAITLVIDALDLDADDDYIETDTNFGRSHWSTACGETCCLLPMSCDHNQNSQA